MGEKGVSCNTIKNLNLKKKSKNHFNESIFKYRIQSKKYNFLTFVF